MTNDTGSSEPISPSLVARLVNRIDTNDEVAGVLDLSDMIVAAWPNGQSMDQ
jgi:hypothetical protein